MAEVLIDNQGIRRAVKKYEYTHAIAEYIWNGFDAGATFVSIDVEANEIGNISKIVISDNGEGISFSELRDKFSPFLSSDKEIDPEVARNSSKFHGKNGVGRLTFFKFAQKAIWQTVYKFNNINYEYEITVSADKLNYYEPSDQEVTYNSVGTKVIFTGISEITLDNFDTDIKLFLLKEFCWFLALHSSQKYIILLNGNPLDIASVILNEETFYYMDTESDLIFEINFIQWKEKPRTEYSRYYLLNSQNEEILKKTTTLNNKSDSFYHSVYIKSDFFDIVDDFYDLDDENDQQQKFKFAGSHEREIYSRLMNFVNGILRDLRRPYLKKLSTELVEEYSLKGIFPKLGVDEWSKIRENELKEFVKELYVVEPKMFQRLNQEQQKTFILLLNLVMDSSEKDSLLKILDEVVRLSPEERNQLANVLQSARLSNITKTITLIQDRLTAISDLKTLLDKDFGANEPKHIQKFIEAHYCLFGEQYHLVTAAEPDFEEALHRYIFFTTGINEKQHLTHPDKNKEMDIFAVRKLKWSDEYENIVVELK